MDGSVGLDGGGNVGMVWVVGIGIVEPAYNGGGKSPISFRYKAVSVINLVCPIQIIPVKSVNSFRYREVSVIIRSGINSFYYRGTKG